MQVMTATFGTTMPLTELDEALTEAGHRVLPVTAAGGLEQAVKTSRPDALCLIVAYPDNSLFEQLDRISRDQPMPLVLFARDGSDETIERAIKARIHAYIVDGLRPERVGSLLKLAVARFEQYQGISTELAKAKQDLEDRKLIDRAKGILMENKQLSESEAYHALRKIAMERNQRLGQVAGDLIAMAKVLG